ncbi:MAG TPA: tRNA (adenosine(37)-N6)-threonylcarbamoyltransferase complex transferase subunit TsaD [Ruminococcaceae bacterium]|nr:tRNA (adenosine(37)-N6)-threonylcarbamoyltransferase complex transferase subunit TsaD [Oscillospiraceae bacterium]
MKILGIESSCDETAAAVVEDGRTVLSNVVSTQIEKHKIFGGVVPEIASRLHTESITFVVREALEKADCTLSDIDAIAVTYAPGLIGALLVGVNYAKGLSFSSGIPLVPVHHLRSHIAANYITHKDLQPPFLCLVVSGGNTLLVKVEDYTQFKVIGRTRDDAAGEALDKAARTMGLPYPGGVNLDKEARGGDINAYTFPKPRVDDNPLDFSFSGLKTSVINTIHNAKQKGGEISVKDLGTSFLNAVVSSLESHTEKAIIQQNSKTLVLAGGVSANSMLRQRMTELAEKHNVKIYFPELSLCGDNAAMVAAQGYYEFMAGKRADMSLNAAATMPITEQM